MTPLYKESLIWRFLGLFWLLVASLLALVVNVPLALKLTAPLAGTGRYLLAWQGVMLYGVGWAFLMSLVIQSTPPVRSAWKSSLCKLAFVWWIVGCVATALVMVGCGSGFSDFPYSPEWGLAVVVLGALCFVPHLQEARAQRNVSGMGRAERTSFTLSIALIVIFSLARLVPAEIPTQVVSRELLSTSWLIAVTTVSSHVYLRAESRRLKTIMSCVPWILVFLTPQPLGWPVLISGMAPCSSVDAREWVVALIWLVVLILGFKRHALTSPVTTIFSLLACLCWVACASLHMGSDAPMALLYRPAILILMTLVTVGGEKNSKGESPSSLLISGGTVVLVLSMMLEGGSLGNATEVWQKSWLLLPMPLSVAWGCMTLGTLWGMISLARNKNHAQSGSPTNSETLQKSEDGEKSSLPNLWVILVLVAVGGQLMYLVIGGLTPSSNQFVVKRPVVDRGGTQIYAVEGCGVCHRQLVRRDPSGLDLQSEVNAGISLPRVSEIEDWSPEGGESVAHLGQASLAPNLFNLVERTRAKHNVSDNEVGEEAWLLRHLYNPRDPMFKTPYSMCPSLADCFEVNNAGTGPSIQVASDLGNQTLKGSAEIQHLVKYLLSLQRGSVCEAATIAGKEVVVSPEQLNQRPYVTSSYAQNPPLLKALSGNAEASLVARGKILYLSKCSQCHGRDGMGREGQYPPLNGSEWVLKSPQLLGQIIRNGVTGPITVKGRQWNTTMWPPGVTETEDVSAIIRFIRKEFGGLENDNVPLEIRDDYQSPNEPFCTTSGEKE